MKRILFLLLFSIPAHAQDTVRIIHRNYLTVYSKTKHYPVRVEWMVTRKDVTCKNPIKRTDKFLPDPVLKMYSDVNNDYMNSGFDRGHLSPAADNACQGKEVMEESFYFTNIAPQYPGLNRGQWKSLEEHTRDLALYNDSILVKAGCFGKKARVKSLTIPTHCWKIITVMKTKETTAYLFPNVPVRSADYTKHQVSVDSIRKILDK